MKNNNNYNFSNTRAVMAIMVDNDLTNAKMVALTYPEDTAVQVSKMLDSGDAFYLAERDSFVMSEKTFSRMMNGKTYGDFKKEQAENSVPMLKNIYRGESGLEELLNTPFKAAQ